MNHSWSFFIGPEIVAFESNRLRILPFGVRLGLVRLTAAGTVTSRFARYVGERLSKFIPVLAPVNENEP